MEDSSDIDKVLLALKYPDYHTWRDFSTVRAGRWPTGDPVRISDPEMKPVMDELKEKIKSDGEFARSLITRLGLLNDESV